jgi:hypothetical protein
MRLVAMDEVFGMSATQCTHATSCTRNKSIRLVAMDEVLVFLNQVMLTISGI